MPEDPLDGPGSDRDATPGPEELALPAAADEDARGGGVSRRRMLGLLGGGAVIGGAAVGGGVGIAAAADQGWQSSAAASDVVPFYGAHQAGIATAAQDRLAFAAFDLTTGSRSQLVALLQSWTQAAAAMTAGDLVGGDAGRSGDGGNTAARLAPPTDTGEAEGLSAANLTVTVGFGPGMFDHRFGLAARKPAALKPLPALPVDELSKQRTGGDLAVQCCADDPQVAFHAMRNLTRLAQGTAKLRWSQLGFGRTSSTTSAQQTPRNLFGFKDGTRNIRAENAEVMGRWVWAGGSGATAWARGGSYLVARRIAMQIEAWDRSSLDDQETTFGRRKISGAPMSGTREFQAPDLAAKDPDGGEAIALNAHIRLASRASNNGIQILRRGYSYTDGVIAETGALDAGLFFIAFCSDPANFIALQRHLGSDALNEYIKHTGSGVWFCPPGPRRGQFLGQALFD